MKIVVHPKYNDLYDFISQLPTNFESSGEIIYKKRNVVKRFKTDSGEWIVKRYKNPNIIQGIAYTFFRKSKAERAYLFASKLLAKGIDTPEAVAYIEIKKYGLLSTSYFISTTCHNPPVYSALIQTPDYDRNLASALAAFFVKLHEKGILHGDPNLDNILFHEDNQGLHFSVIDTNRSIFKRSLTRNECLDNLKRIAHRRDLLQYIVEEYALKRQWDIQQSVHQVMNALDKFEKRRKIKRIIKGKK